MTGTEIEKKVKVSDLNRNDFISRFSLGDFVVVVVFFVTKFKILSFVIRSLFVPHFLTGTVEVFHAP